MDIRPHLHQKLHSLDINATHIKMTGVTGKIQRSEASLVAPIHYVAGVVLLIQITKQVNEAHLAGSSLMSYSTSTRSLSPPFAIR